MKTLPIISAVAISIALTSSFAYAGLSDPFFDFCQLAGLSSAGKIEIPLAKEHGVQYSESIVVSMDGMDLNGADVPIGVYFNNLGPGAITYFWDKPSGEGSWSVFGNQLATAFNGLAGQDLDRGAVYTSIALTPRGSKADFSDLGWGGTFEEGIDFIGCTKFKEFTLHKKRGATAHMDVSFFREGEEKLHTVRVNIHFIR